MRSAFGEQVVGAMNSLFGNGEPLLVRERSGASGSEDSTLGGLGHLFPVNLGSTPPSTELLQLYAIWLETLGKGYLDRGSPWLPVGRLGPLLMLGNCEPLISGPPLPELFCQPVLLSEDDYARLHRSCAENLSSSPQRNGFQPPRRLPGGSQRPSDKAAALRLLLEQFPLEEPLRSSLEDCLEGPWEDNRLPFGYAQALHHLLGRGAVADLSHLEAPASLLARMPQALPRGLLPLGAYGRKLWVASPRSPSPQIEDLLLDEFGEGWSVRFVRCAEAVSEAQAAGDWTEASAQVNEEGRSGERPQRICIETPLRPVATGGVSDTPGEIRLSPRDIAELSAYDPRRPDRDPAKVFLRMLSAGIREGASDLHLEPGLERFRVRARVDGLLEEWLDTGMDFGQALVGAAKELLGLPAEKFLPQDGSCVVRHGSDQVSVRVSSFPIRRRRQKLVLRLLPRRGRVPPLDELMPAGESSLLRQAMQAPAGLILVCGPTGSGKTTTVFSALAELNTAGRNITTMEDPVEYELEGVNQSELDPYRGVTWEPLLRGFLRQDPDVAMLGEIRDRVSAETAVRQALTGHLVFATLHTLSCAQTVDRLLDMGANPELLASSLTLVISQRLVRRLCVCCRQRSTPSAAEQALFSRHGLTPPRTLWTARSSGCPSCRHGYKGRLAVFEFLPVSQAVASLIESRAGRTAYAEWARRQGFRSLHASALDLAARGLSSLQEACEWRDVWEDKAWET